MRILKMVFFSKHMEAIPPSATLKTAQLVFQLERQGIKVVRLDAGQPDFDTPDSIKNAAIQALKEGFTKYTSSRGIIDLREAILDVVKGRPLFAAAGTRVHDTDSQILEELKKIREILEKRA